MKKLIKNKRTEKIIEYPPYKCKVCGIGDVEEVHDICDYCGWEDDGLQNNNPDYTGGANKMSLNQHKKFWNDNKEYIMKHDNDRCLFAVKLSHEYYKRNFQNK